MKYKANKTTRLLKTPGGEKVDTLSRNEEVTDTGQTSGDFIQVDPGDGNLAWVLKADLTPLERPEFDIGGFVAQCITVE